MEPAQQPPGIDQVSVPGQRTSPGQAAAAPAQQIEPGQAATVPGQAATVPGQRTAPGQVTPGPVSPLPRRTRQYLRPILAVLSGMLLLLCLGGVGVGYVLYDGASTPDRSAPDAVVDNYLRAFLVDRNDAQADLYVCNDTTNLHALHAFRADIESREQQFAIRIHVTWGSLAVASLDETKRVTTEIRRAIADGSEQAHELWQFEVVNEDGWRVCSASRVD